MSLPAETIDLVCDGVAAVVGDLRLLPAAQLPVLAQLFREGNPKRLQVAWEYAENAARSHRRELLLHYALREVEDVLHPAPTAAMWALKSAVMAMVMADVLPEAVHGQLLEPLRQATARATCSPRRPSPPAGP